MIGKKANNPRTGLEIAVIGMAGRFPGAKDIQEFWENLKNGVESISFFSDAELEKNGVSKDLLENPNFVKGKGIITDSEYFDSSFFNYTSREAQLMDPQVRIFHECAWSALEDAGYDPGNSNIRIGLYAGASSNQTWEGLCIFSDKGREIGEWESGLLMDKDYMSVRISYKLNLKGPSFTMQSACSTSLAAVHLGCRALLTGECDMALVGGVCISASKVLGYLYQEGMILSRDGHCRAFDAEASGTVGGEGIGIAVLKRLNDAVAARDNIYAVVKGSVINNDGKRKIGFSAPSIDGQAECIRSALHLSQITPERISYIETHGTGTTLGDPIEIEALKLAFNTEKKKYCRIGSVKSNIGHLDTAAGIAGFIKTVLVLKYKLIPPSLHFHIPNPKIDFDNSPFYVNKELTEWKNDEFPFCAGVSSFGIGGTNAHVILEEAPAVVPANLSLTAADGDYCLILLSARSQTALDKMTANLVEYLKNNPGINIADTTYTLHVGRKTFNHRKMAIYQRTTEAVESFSTPGAANVYTHHPVKENPPVIFMFPGQGAQYVNMGLELYKTEPIFRQELERCFEILKPLVNGSIKTILYPDESTSQVISDSLPQERINQTEITQPVIFIFEYALAKLLMAWGVKPYAMIGHSIGEYTAACLAEVFTLEDALNLVVWRGKLMQKISTGAMLAVPLPEAEILSLLNDQISLAAVNSSSLSVVSGTHEAIDRFTEDMKKRGCETTRLHTSHAFHSAMMDPILDEFETQVKKIKLNNPQLPYISNVTGKWITSDDVNNPGYWKRHLRETVLFSRGVEELLKESNSIFMEVGPGKVLSTFLRQHDRRGEGHHTVNLIRHPKENISDRYSLLNALGQTWLYGAGIDWESFYAYQKRWRISLPTYPFEGQRYWIDLDLAKMAALKLSQETELTKKEDIADWFYLPTWKRDLTPIGNKKKRKTLGPHLWLILMDDSNAGHELAKRLEVEGEVVICVKTGKEFQKTDDRNYILDPGKQGDYNELFKDLKKKGKVPGTIIHLLLLSSAGEPGAAFDTASLESTFDRGFYSLIYLAQAIEKHDVPGKINIEIVTNNMQDVSGEEDLNPAKSIILGACKIIPQEYPNVSCRNIDIIFNGSGSTAEGLYFDRLIAEFKLHVTGDVLAYRNNRRWVQVFEPLRLEKTTAENICLKPNGVYLVTGGLGKIGLAISGYLAAEIKAKLILISRSGLPPREKWDQHLKDYHEKNNANRAIKKIKEFEKLGAEVFVFSADVSDDNQMQEVIVQAEKQFGPINGVIHTAGVVGGESFRLIKDIDKTICRLQFLPKISGVMVLHRLLKDKPLDFCLLTSSVSAVLGGLTFAAYSAANIFLDAFATWHNKLNPSQPWISVNFDGWLEEDETSNNNSRVGKLAMKPSEGIEVFKRILSCEGLTHVINSTGNLHTRIQEWVQLQSVQEKEDIPSSKESISSLYVRAYLTNPYVPPNTPEQTTLCQIWQELFGFQQVGIHDNFFELGGDSLKAITLSARIHKALDMKIPLTEFFNRQTIAGIAEYVVNNKKTEFFSMDIAEEKEYYELSPGQKRLFILKQMNLEGTSYNLPEFLVIEMELVFEKLEEASRKLIKRHEMLRTAFQLVDEKPVQKIYKEINFEIEFYEPGFESEEYPTSRAILEKITKEFVRTFDLTRPPLFRMGIVKLGGNRFLLMKDMHHIISDAVTHVIFIKDLLALYRETPLPELNFQYKDFSEWQQKSRNENNGVLRKQEEYWLQVFPGEIPILNIPSDYARPLVQSFDGRTFNFEINEEETQELRKLALQEGITLYILIFTIFNILLSKISGQEDIIIGTPVVGRRHVDFQQIIGLFINILALRNYPIGEEKFRDFLGTVKKKILDAFENQEYPFEELVEKVQVNRDVSRTPLFNVMFLLQNLEVNELKSDEPMQVSAFNYENRVSKFDLSLLVIEGREKLLMTFEYCVKLFEEETIKKFTEYLSHLLKGITDGLDQRLYEIQIMDDSEKLRLLEEINGPQVDYPYVEGMHRLFEIEVDLAPDNTVLIYGQEHLTGKCLNERSNMLAGFLVGKGVIPGNVVGVVVERSLEMVVGIVGLLKAGAIYLPIDIELPPDRKKYMIQDSRTKIILSKQQIPAISGDTLEIVYLEREESFSHVKENLYIGSQAESPAYIIYTSGSTGKSKGVVVHHRSILNTLMWRMGCYKFDRDDIVLQIPSISFDSSVEDIFTPLSSGSKIVLIKQAERLNLEYLGTLIRKERITHFLISPALYNVFLEKIPHDLANLKTVTVAGESFTMKLVEEHFRKQQTARLFNEYGPTENSVCATVYEFHRDNTKILIGKPLDNVACYILDKYKKLLPVGIIGELCISGKSLAAGYLNNQELTSSKFIANPYKKKHFLYCTGDLARRLPDGNIEFLGRIDFQIKIRGFRVELGEIESRLLNYPGVKESVVTVQEDESDKYLSAYIVTDKENEISGIREFLLNELPEYMIPSYFVYLDKIPLNSSGKVDRKALPKPELRIEQDHVSPRNEMEVKLVNLWADVLNIQPELIGIDNNFFQLGGHSLKATILVSKIHKAFDVKVSLAEIFKTPRIRELAEYIKGKSKEFYISIEPAEEKEYYELSPAQKRLYILQQMVADNTSYNMPYVISLWESIEKVKLESVFKRLIERHESLRTSFITVNEEPVQRIHRGVDFHIGCYEIKEEAEVNPLISSFTTPFNLGAAPLLRVNLVAVGLSRRVLFIDMHHIITDGTSQGILEKEFLALQEEKELPALHLHYKDYSEWYNGLLRQEAINQQESYWMKEFNDEIPVLDLPTDYPRPSIQSIEGNVVSFSLNVQETDLIKVIAKKNEATPYMVLLAIFNILLSKLSGQEDIIIGTPIAARRHSDLENVIGMLVNTLAMRNYPSGHKTFKNFLREVRVQTLAAYENQEYPFEVLVDKITVNRDAGRNPVFDIMFNLLNQADYKGDASGQNEQDSYMHIKGTAKFDMNLAAVEIGEKFLFTLEYSTRLFKPERIERIIGYYKNIVKVLSHDSGLKISEIEIMDKRDKEEVLRLSSGVEWSYEGLETIHGLFEEQVERTPDTIALVGTDKREEKKRRRIEEKNGGVETLCATSLLQITYCELNEQSNRLAHWLKKKGVGPDSAVGLMVERSVEMITGILAIMKAGGAYLPIDSEYPAERKRYILEDGKIRWLLVNDNIEDIRDEIINRLEIIDLRQEEIYRSRNGNLDYIGSGSDLVYVIYTSGSTGKPKGVMLEHRNLVNLLKFQFKYTNIDCSRILQFSTISFDASFHEIFSAFLSGGELFLVNKETRTDVPELFRLIERNGIKTVFLPISFLKVIFKEEEYLSHIPQSICHIQTAGEQVVISKNFKNYLKKRQVYLHNHYGPSETHVVTTLTIDPGGDIAELPSIGKPVMNTGIYIVDKFGQMLPPGVTGEIWIGGVQVGRGYLNRPELTADKFINFHHSSFIMHNSILYRTGDLARLLSDGNIEFLGRIDHQVKIRGFRVELGEIENRLLNYPGIKEVVVLAREEKGDKSLCAYIVSDREYELEGLGEYLSKELPEYMIPSHFVQLEIIPLTHNGKIDRRALPQPEVKAEQHYIAPRNETEAKLVGLWAEILNIQPDIISIDRNFFELGGHSLKATVLAARIHKELNVKLPLAVLFKTPTIRGLSEYIRGTVEDIYESIMPVEEKEYYDLSFAQKRMYILQQIELSGAAYNMPEIVPLAEEIDIERLEESFKKLIKRHDSLRTSFHIIGDQPVQRVHDYVEFEIEYLATDKSYSGQTGTFLSSEATSYEGTEIEDQYSSFIIHHFIRDFDLTKAPLLRVGVLKTAEGRNYLSVDMHHIISDGVSHEILVNDFLALYDGKVLPPLRIQYKDFVQWQNSPKELERIDQQMRYWLKEFEGEIPVLEIPTDYPRPKTQSFAGDEIYFETSVEETQGLKTLALKGGATLFMVLAAAINILLSKLSGQEDIIIGTPLAGRRHADLEKIIGMFVNTLVLRNYPLGEQTFNEFLSRIKEQILIAFENQEYPFEELVDKLSLKRDMGRNPLFDVMFDLQNMNFSLPDVDAKNEPEIEQKVQMDLAQNYKSIMQIAKFDLTFSAIEVRRKILFSIEYCTKLFKKETIERFITYFKKIVVAIINDPGIKLQHIDIVAEKEKEQLLFDFNKTTEIYSKEKMIYRLIEEQVERIPGNIALNGPSVRGENIQLSYRELNRKSNQLAYILRAKGIISNSVVGVMIRRSIEMIVGLLGVLKSGGAYMPIDPLYPFERKRRMLKDSAAKLLLAEGNSEIGNIGSCELIDMKNKNLFSGNPGNPGIENLDNDLIYTIFTSGSTGYPKGSGVYHRGFLNLVNWFVKEFALNSKDSVLVLTSLSFDLTQKNIYAPLLVGGRLYIPGVDYFEPSALLLEVWQDKITWINCTPGMFYKMVEVEEDHYLLSGLRYVFLGGEPISMKMLVGWLESSECKAEIVNTYGPTECSDVCTYYRLRDWESSRENVIPIGKPVSNTQLYVLNRYFQVIPIGVGGELFIAGAGVGAGYINHSEMTWEKFIKISLPGNTLVECYRTGDLARWMANGNIEFLGRIDFQLKIRGFRVEIGEIENHLLNYPSIKRAVVLSREDGNEDKYLCAYIVSEKEYKVAELREYLLKGLPDYMIPSYFVFLEKIPLTPNGKVDRRSLPQPELKTEQDYVAPRDRTETKLVELWADVLNIQASVISINRSFFELGGHSLKGTILASRIHKEFNVILPLAELFKTPTISGLSKFISGKVENIYESIMPVEEKEYYVLSFAQQRIYILQQIDLNSTAYNMPQIIPLHEAFDIVHLEESFKKLITRHESLRTSFHMIDDQPVQRIHDNFEFKIERLEDKGQAIGLQIRAFDLSKAPLLRVGFLKTVDRKQYLLVDMHHIISDGISNDILGDDFMALYKEIELPPLRIQYKDFAQWQNSPKELERIDQQMRYWLKEFEGEIPVLEIPTDYPRPISQSFAGNSIDFEIAEEETKALNKTTLQGGATLFMILAAAVNILLSKLSGQEEIIIGSPIAGRRHADLEKIIGMFVNTLAIKNYPIGQRTFGDFLAEVKKRMLKIFENQEYPFEALVDKLALKRDMGRNPLFDVMFAFQNMNSVSTNQDDKSVQTDLPNEYVNIGQTAKFDLTFTAAEIEQKIVFSIQYCTKLFKKKTIERFITYLKKIAVSIVNNPYIKLQNIDIIPDEEKKWMLDDFNNTEALYPKNKTIHQLFEEQVARTPDRIALIGADGEMKKRRREEEKNGNLETLRATSLQIQMSYRQLNEQSDHLAGLLSEKGVLPDTIVAIMAERSIEIIVGILGILKSGGAYLPIDPEYPRERIDFMLKDSSLKLLVVANDLEGEKVRRWEGEKVLLDSIIYSNHLNGCPRRGLHHSSHLAYVIYTSGSTGKPKGVMIDHLGLVNYICWSVKRYVKNENVNFPLYTSPSFDLTITSIFTPLVSGRVIFLYEGVKGDILIDRIIEENSVEVCKLTPSHLKLIRGKKFENSNIKRFIVGGEELETQLALDIFSNLNGNIEIYNEYGPTETVVGCMEYKYNPEERDKYSVPIGVPIDNVRIYVLDNYMNPVPVLVLGEICIGGDCIARGYLNKPAITAEKFVRNPFIPGQKIYKTGDLARRLPNGNIEFIGRLDNQVKIRGFRIELGEIESQILIHKSVKEAVIIAQDDKIDIQNQLTLCAYIVPDSDFDLPRLQEYLLGKLPDYMIPSYFVLLDKIPLTPNGKVDRKALPRPEFKARQDYVAPRNSMEVKLVQLWADVLNVQPEIISINQNFFELGGHSLKATVLAYRIHKELDVILPLGELFKAPTIKDIGKYLENAKSTIYYKNIDWNLVLIKEGSPGDNHLFFIHDGSGEVEGYVEFCKHLTGNFNYWGIRADRLENLAPHNISIRELAETYIGSMKKIQPHGPYYICGWSLGGTIAVEIVKQLEHEGQPIPFLALIDVTSPLGYPQKNEIKFTTQTETEWMQTYLGHDDKIKQILTKKTSNEGLWDKVVDYLAGSPMYNTPKAIEALIPQHMIRLIPHFHQLSLKQVIQYFNRIRSLENARNRYMPGEKLVSSVHFFAADRSSVLAGGRWTDHFKKPLKIYKIKGDHFSIMQMPEVIEFAGIFDQILQEVKS